MLNRKLGLFAALTLFLLSSACVYSETEIPSQGEEKSSPTKEFHPSEPEVTTPYEENLQTGNASPLTTSTALPDPLDGVTVIAWLGHIAGLPEGSQHDDKVVLSPPGTGEFGLTGATPEIEAEIDSLRDMHGPHEFAHLWGTLFCKVNDVNNCQLVVEKLQYGANFSEENFKNWQGTIKRYSFNGGDSSVFELKGDYLMWYSIRASQNPEMQAKIENLRDTGAFVEVSGKLLVGIPDVNGTRIEPGYLEVVEIAQPAKTDLSPETIASWPVFENDIYEYQIQHPPEAIISFFGPTGFATAEKPENMTAEEYMNSLIEEFTDRICIRIEYSLGWVSIAAPPNKARMLTPCGPTGVGTGNLVSKVENIEIGHQLYEAKGYEIMLKLDDGADGTMTGETLDMHYEMYRIELDDGTVIQFGSSPNHEATYNDYRAQTREVLLQIMNTYQKFP